MGKRFFIGFNLLLAAVLSVRLVALCMEIRYAGTGKSQHTAYQQTEIKRPVIRMSASYRPLFGLDPGASNPAAKARPGADGDDHGRNELLLADVSLRVRGIFISSGKSCAVFELGRRRQKKKNAAVSLEKVETGASIKGFTVADIRPGVVILEDKTGNRIRMRIFKPDLTRVMPASK